MDTVILNSIMPKNLGYFELSNKEYMQYLYLPVKLSGDSIVVLEPRLEFLREMLHTCRVRWINTHMYDNYQDVYVYLTIKQTFVAKDTHHNRPGFHSDGFGTDDVQYIWYDKFPTEFLLGTFEAPNDDVESMKFFNIALGDLLKPKCKYLYEIDSNHIHRTTPATEDGVRTFVKITFSKSIYAQEGNSVNYLLDYDWDYSQRSIDRNQPHAK